MCPRVQRIALSRPGLAKGQCARESARPGILGQGRGKTCRTGVGTCGGIGSPSSFSRLKTASRSSRLPFLLPSGRILTFILPFHTRAVGMLCVRHEHRGHVWDHVRGRRTCAYGYALKLYRSAHSARCTECEDQQAAVCGKPRWSQTNAAAS